MMVFCSNWKRISFISAYLAFSAQISVQAAELKPYGFAAGVTGGGNAKPAAPPDIRTLKEWLQDSTPRVILIDKLFDFTDAEGNMTGAGCAVWPECTNGNKVQVAIDYRGWCSEYEQKSAKRITVNYRKAAITPLVIGSNKSILGVGNQGVIKGKGLVINKPARNIIIQNIEITYLNPFAVWGGDALTFNAAADVWVDHCTFSLIGRQMISSGSKSGNTGITISNNLFVGKTPWSFDCRGQHYWTIIFGGNGDKVTLADNCFVSTSGRSPKLGAIASTQVLVHSFNNYHSSSRGQVMEVVQGGTLLAEANVFDNVGPADAHQAVSEGGGALYAPFTPQEEQACQSALGRVCQGNLVHNPPQGAAPMKFALNKAVLNSVRALPVLKGTVVKPSSLVLARKTGHCGKGKM